MGDSVGCKELETTTHNDKDKAREVFGGVPAVLVGSFYEHLECNRQVTVDKFVP